jgi:signal transduction histidine kinase
MIGGPTGVRSDLPAARRIADCNRHFIPKRYGAFSAAVCTASGAHTEGLPLAADTMMVTAGFDTGAQRLRFLADASRLLAASIDYEATLKTVARLLVPDIADWCVVDLLQADGTLARVAIEHRDPVRRDLARRLRECFPPRVDATSGPANVARTGRTEFEVAIADAILRRIAPEPDRLRLLSQLGMHSYISAPLATRDRLLGTITLFTEAPRVFDADDALMAEDLAHRAATAIDHARLYEDALRAARARDEMLAIVTHDLRTPLSAIMTAAALQLATAGDENGGRVRARAETIQRSARHMHRLIRDLTDLGQIDGGRFAIEPASQDVTSLLRYVVDTLQPVAARNRSEMRMNIVGPIPPVVCDAERVIQVLSNLASNAINVGSPSVLISVEARGPDVLFTVSDSGPGIAPEDLPFMFDRYWRARSPHYKGTGLGLPIAKGIVDAHGGRIWVHSQLGAGTQFFFTLPC